jgi:hypothetical protein
MGFLAEKERFRDRKTIPNACQWSTTLNSAYCMNVIPRMISSRSSCACMGVMG